MAAEQVNLKCFAYVKRKHCCKKRVIILCQEQHYILIFSDKGHCHMTFISHAGEESFAAMDSRF